MIPQNHSFSFLFIPFRSSTPRFYVLEHKKVIYFKISSIFIWRFQIFFVLLPTLIRR
nr:MAG TPA: Connexin [Caudoviricetes sp.]